MKEDFVKIENPMSNLKMEPAILVCKKHGEYNGWIGSRVEEGNVISWESECIDCYEIRLREDTERVDREREAIVASAKERQMELNPNIPKRFQKKSFNSFNPSCEAAEEVKKRIGNYILGHKETIEEGKSMLFLGRPGTGKSHLGWAIINNYMINGYKATGISTVNFFSKVKESWNDKSSTEFKLIESYDQYEILMIDEVGKSGMSASEKNMFFHLMNNRFEKCLPTICISNLSKNKLIQMLDEETVRRMHEGGGILEFNWEPFQG